LKCQNDCGNAYDGEGTQARLTASVYPFPQWFSPLAEAAFGKSVIVKQIKKGGLWDYLIVEAGKAGVVFLDCENLPYLYSALANQAANGRPVHHSSKAARGNCTHAACAAAFTTERARQRCPRPQAKHSAKVGSAV
jgi:hypothetical protein